MLIKGVIQYAHHLLEESVSEGEIVIDATCGNGNDTLFLSKLVGDEGRVIGFDIQKEAIESTSHLLKEHKRTNMTLVHDSHAEMYKYVSSQATIGGAIFNLGYLPRSDKKIITKPESTIEAIDKILPILKRRGMIVLVVYHGHDGGKDEKKELLKHIIELDQKQYTVLRYGFINQKNNPPFILAIQKK
ncbi:MAG TPA: class I SAM-dependent methyltransferase [Bacillota bacterium]|nr:class I SAM-dependent methyltransferase [Bacillota bacterium]